MINISKEKLHELRRQLPEEDRNKFDAMLKEYMLTLSQIESLNKAQQHLERICEMNNCERAITARSIILDIDELKVNMNKSLREIGNTKKQQSVQQEDVAQQNEPEDVVDNEATDDHEEGEETSEATEAFPTREEMIRRSREEIVEDNGDLVRELQDKISARIGGVEDE